MTGDQEPPEPIRAGSVVGGVVLGLIAAFFYFFLAFFGTYANGIYVEGPLMWVLTAVPAVVGVLLLLFPRTRHAGAGLVIGLAVGMIVLPGVCTTLPLLLGG